MKRFIAIFIFWAIVFVSGGGAAYADLTDGLVAFYPFSNGGANDVSGKGNHGTIYGAVPCDDRFGNPNGAYSFDGVNDYIDIGNDSSLKHSLPVTIMGWVNMSENNTFAPFFGNNFTNNHYNGVWLRAGDHINASFGDGGQCEPRSRRSKKGSTIMTIGDWYHICAVIRGANDIDLYLNGKNDGGSYSGSGGVMNYDNSSGVIGVHDNNIYNPNLYYHGKVDEIRFYNRALSEEEINNLYKISVPQPDPTAGDFDGDGDIDAFDLSQFASIYGTENYSDELITLTEVPVLDQDDYSYLSGPGGCVPVSFAMLFINYFNMYNGYSLNIESTTTEEIVQNIAQHLDAYVDSGGTWVKASTMYDRMDQYTIIFDIDAFDSQHEQVEWVIEYPSIDEKTNDEWIDFIKEKLSNGEPVLITGDVVAPDLEGGHASMITGYKKVCGAEHVKVHDTWDKIPKWWRVMKNKSLTVNGSTQNGLLRLHRNNGDILFFITGRMVNPTNMTVYIVPDL